MCVQHSTELDQHGPNSDCGSSFMATSCQIDKHTESSRGPADHFIDTFIDALYTQSVFHHTGAPHAPALWDTGKSGCTVSWLQAMWPRPCRRGSRIYVRNSILLINAMFVQINYIIMLVTSALQTRVTRYTKHMTHKHHDHILHIWRKYFLSLHYMFFLVYSLK